MNSQTTLRNKIQSILKNVQLEQLLFDLKKDGVNVGRSTVINFIHGIKISAEKERLLTE